MDREGDQLRSFLANADAPCPSCDYNLRGLTGDICPECNQRLTLRVGLAEPRQRAFIATLVALAMGAGFHGLLVVYWMIALVKERFRAGRLMESFVIITSVATLIEGPALIALVVKRRAFQRRSDTFKAWCIVLSWTVTIVGFALFTASIR